MQEVYFLVRHVTIPANEKVIWSVTCGGSAVLRFRVWFRPPGRVDDHQNPVTLPDRDSTSCLSLQLSVAMSRQKTSAKTLIIADGEFGQTRDRDEELCDEAQSSNFGFSRSVSDLS